MFNAVVIGFEAAAGLLFAAAAGFDFLAAFFVAIGVVSYCVMGLCLAARVNVTHRGNA